MALWPVAASLLAAVGSALLAAYLWRYRGKPGADWFLTSLVSQAVWSGAYGAALLTFDPGLRRALETLVWAAMTGTCFYFLAFALAYTGRGRLLTGRGRLFAGMPAVTAAVVATNPIHGLAWEGFALDPVAGLATVTYAMHPWSMAGTTIGVLLVSVGSLLLFDTVVSYGPLYRREAVAVGLSTVPPVGALLVWLSGLGPVPELNLVTVMFLPHIALDAYAFVGSDMFEFHPATRRAGERAAIDDLGSPVVVVDEQHRVVTLNAAAAERFGVSKRAALTRPLAAILGTEVDPTDPEGVVTVREDGRRSEFKLTSTRLTGAGGTDVGYTVVFQDVTAERLREQRLDVLNRVLRHNLRNDMDVIRGYADAAASAAQSDEVRSFTETITDKSDDLLGLGEQARTVERVLDRDGSVETVALDDVLADAVATASDDHEGTVRRADSGLQMETDPAVLEAVVRALVTNALEHGGSDPTVTVTGERVADGVAVRVSDDGPGIPAYELDVLDSGAESALEHGSGLGLWIADWGARTLSGDLSFETGEDGTTATVTLPAAGREA